MVQAHAAITEKATQAPYSLIRGELVVVKDKNPTNVVSAESKFGKNSACIVFRI